MMHHAKNSSRLAAALASDGLWQDLRLGVRVLLRSRLSTAAAIATLAIGIGCSAAIFSFVDARDPRLLVGVAGILLAVALVACVGPARRAAGVDPMAVLRSD